MERCDLLSVKIGHILHDLTVGSVIDIHIRYEHHTGQLVSVTQLPCLLGSHFHAGLTGNNDDSRICSADCFFHFTDKIKETGGIQYINLHTLPFNRDNGRAD